MEKKEENARCVPELLAPAGGFAQMKAAVENGADAVYMGGKLFNARMGAENFGEDQLPEAIRYAHSRGVKIHVTVNTLLTDRELPAALSEVVRLYEEGADAFIIQDLGLASVLRRAYPEIPLHLSTQATVYNVEGLQEAARLGFTRAVLARETTMAELVELTKDKPLELEVFVHGALCVCYSGQCQLSREIGGRSGNRGVCAQPCRLPYQNGGEKSAFPLSPKDLCSLEFLPELCRLGVDSLKIEGRMKSPEYVAVVTSIYRKYLDRYVAGTDGSTPEGTTESWTVEPEDVEALQQIFSRGPFTTGYWNGNPGSELMSGSLAKHQGLPLGTVVAPGPGPKQVTVKLERRLCLGDGVEIQTNAPAGERLPGNVVTFIKRGGELVRQGLAGEMVILGDIVPVPGGDIQKGDPIYRITEKRQLEEARESYENRSGAAEKEGRKTPVYFTLEAGLEREVRLTVRDDDGYQASAGTGEAAQPAINRPLTGESAQLQLSKTGGTPFRLEGFEALIEEGISVPASLLNRLRRTVLEELEQRRVEGRTGFSEERRQSAQAEMERAVGCGGNEGQERGAGGFQTSLYLFRTSRKFYQELADELSGRKAGYDRYYLPYTDFLSSQRREWLEAAVAAAGTDGFRGETLGAKRLILTLPQVTQGRHDQVLRERFDELCQLGREYGGISIGNLGWLRPFLEAGVKVYGDYGLNFYNSADFAFAAEFGLAGAVISHERSAEQAAVMDFHGLQPEFAVSGEMPMMVSRHDFTEEMKEAHRNFGKSDKQDYLLKDRKDVEYPVWKDPEGDETIIFYRKNEKIGRVTSELNGIRNICLRFYVFR